MKILCVSDDKDILVYSPNIVERYGDVDLILSAGDLPMKCYEYIVSTLNKPFYFIFGNHDLKHLHRFRRHGLFDIEASQNYTADMSYSVGGDCIEGKVVRDKKTGLLIAGLGGSMKYNSGEHQFNEVEMMLRLLKLIPRLIYNRLRYGRYLDILLTHAAPREVGDREDLCHRGFRVFRAAMKWFRPRYLLHGHVHLIDLNRKRETQFLDTEVINIYSSYILEESDRNGS